MTAEWVLTLVQSLINIKAVMAAVVLTQFVKRLLPSKPSPTDEALTFLQKFSVRSGPFLDRLVPFLPVFFAVVIAFFVERDSTYTMEDFFRGIASGAFAGYTYSTTKTMIFGGDKCSPSTP